MTYNIEITDDGFQFDTAIDSDTAIDDVLRMLRSLLEQHYGEDCVVLAAAMEDGTARGWISGECIGHARKTWAADLLEKFVHATPDEDTGGDTRH